MRPSPASEWNAAAPTLAAIPLAEERVRYAATLRPLLPLARDARVLEAGCGSGRMLRALERIGFTRVVGLEISRERLAQVRRLGPSLAPLVCGDGVPFRDASFDAVVTAAVIEHVPNPEAWFLELVRVTRPGGLISITTDSLMWNWLQALGLYRSVQPFDRAIAPARLLGWAHDAGLDLLSCGGFENTAGQRHYLARQLVSVASPRRLGSALGLKVRGKAPAAAAPAAHEEKSLDLPAIEAFPADGRRDTWGCVWSYECFYWFRRRAPAP